MDEMKTMQFLAGDEVRNVPVVEVSFEDGIAWSSEGGTGHEANHEGGTGHEANHEGGTGHEANHEGGMGHQEAGMHGVHMIVEKFDFEYQGGEEGRIAPSVATLVSRRAAMAR